MGGVFGVIHGIGLEFTKRGVFIGGKNEHIFNERTYRNIKIVGSYVGTCDIERKFHKKGLKEILYTVFKEEEEKREKNIKWISLWTL